MNNINQKNVIYSMKPSNELPYKQVEWINHNECCETINEVDINNLANQLVDNDVYVEQYLNHTSSYIVGPKAYDQTTISSQPNGYKVFGQLKGSNYLPILHKVEKPLQETVTKLQDGNVNAMKRFGDLIVANIQGAVKCTYDPINGPWEVLYWHNGELQTTVDAVDIYTSQSGCFVAADSGIFQLSAGIEYDESTGNPIEHHSLVKLDDGHGHLSATCIAVDERESRVYVGCERPSTKMLAGAYKAGLGVGNAGNVHLAPVNLYSGNEIIKNERINDIDMIESTGDVVAAGDHSLYTKTIKDYLQDEVVLTASTEDDFPVSFNSSIYYNGRLFFGSTNAGLWYKAGDDTLARVEEIHDNLIVKLVQGNGKLYVATELDVYQILPSFQVQSSSFSGHGAIKSIEMAGPCVVVATLSGLWNFDGTIQSPYAFQMRDAGDIEDIRCSNGYLALASISALSAMAIRHSNGPQETPVISCLEEMPIAGIDGNQGNSGFIKFVSVVGHRLAVFKTKIQCLDNANASFDSSSTILNAISLGSRDDIGYLAVSLEDSLVFLSFDGEAFEMQTQFDEILSADNLAYVDDLVVASNSSLCALSSWRLGDYDFLNSNPWLAYETQAPFTDIRACGLCAVCQVSSDGLSAFAKTSIADKIPDESQLSDCGLLDACAVDWLSTQFLAYDGNHTAKAFILSALSTSIDDEDVVGFAGPISIGDANANAKRIEVTQDPDDKDTHYAYVLNKSGKMFCYQLIKELDNGQLTSLSSSKEFETTTTAYSDLQKVTSHGIDGALLTRDLSVQVHLPALGAPANFLATPVGYVIPILDEVKENQFDRRLIYSIGNQVVLSSIDTGETFDTVLSSLNSDADKVQIGFNGLYAKHGQTVAMSYTQQSRELCHDMVYVNDDVPSTPAAVTDFVVCQASTRYGEDDVAELDLVVAAIGSVMHVVPSFGDAIKDFSSSSEKYRAPSQIKSIAAIQITRPDEDITTSFVVLGTETQMIAIKLQVVVPSDPTQAVQIASQMVYGRALDYSIQQIIFDKQDHIVCLDTTGEAHIFPIEVTDSSISVGDETETIAQVEAIFQETRLDKDPPCAWIQADGRLSTVDKIRSMPIDVGFSCNSIATTNVKGKVVLGSASGLYVSSREMSQNSIETIFKAPQDLRLRSASYAGGVVFVAGEAQGLSCFQLLDPLTTFTCLNDSTGFARCHASESREGEITLIAWTEHEVFSQTYDDASAIAPYSFDSTTTTKMFQNISAEYVMDQSDQLLVEVPLSESEFPVLNAFAALTKIPALDYDGVFLGDSANIYYDDGQYGLFEYAPDSSTKMQKFICQDEYIGHLLYVDGNAVYMYPSTSHEPLLSCSGMDDAILNSGQWYWHVHNNGWKYQPIGTEMAFPLYSGQPVTNINGATTVDGSTCFGTNYGVLKATFVKQNLIEEDRSIKELECNFAWNGKFKSLNQSTAAFKMLVVAEDQQLSNAIAYETDIRYPNTTEEKEVKFYPPADDPLSANPATVSEIWCVNQQRTDGMFCLPVEDLSHEYTKWLNRINGTRLQPFTGVSINGINQISRHNDGYYLLCNDQIVKFSQYGKVLAFQRVPSSTTSENGYSSFAKTADSKLLVVGRGGLGAYADGQLQMIKLKDGIDVAASYVLDGSTKYLHNDGATMLSSSNYKIWRPFLQLPDQVKNSTVAGADCLNQRTYIFATSNGLYGTRYAFDMVNDIAPMTKDQALSTYNDLIASSLSSELSTALSIHLSSDHLPSSMITRLNEDYATVQLDDIAVGWQRVEVSSEGAKTLGIRNDIVAQMSFGTGNDGDVVAQISNFLNDDGTVEEISSMTYIVKRWMSGMTELFINVPTTKTYYLNNLYGASDCKVLPQNSMTRKNLDDFGIEKMEQTGVLSDHYTLLQIGLASAEYSVDRLVDVQINGMSLPLKIYKEKSAGEGRPQDNLYRSFIEPSVGSGYNIETTDVDGNWIFNFACFGTDAQAVHLMFYDEKARSGGATIKVVFDANGGDGVMSPEKFTLAEDQDGYLVPTQKPLKKCKFTNTSAGYEKIFAGWSIHPLPDNEAATYEDGQLFPTSTKWVDLANELEIEVSDVLKNKDEIKLYAVWLTYQFSENDTTLVFNSSKSELAINAVGVDESTKLKDKVVINWGE